MANIHIDHTLIKLEFNKIVEKISSYAKSPCGVQKILSLKPTAKKDEVIYNYEITKELTLFLNNEEPILITKIFNSEEEIVLAQKGAILSSVKLFELATSVKNYFYLKKRFDNDKYPKLKDIFTVVSLKDNFYIEVLKYIKEDGYVESGASKELGEIRLKIDQVERDIKKETKSFYTEQKNSGYTVEDIVSIRDGFECIAIKSNYKGRIDGVVLDYSKTGQTVYVTPSKVLELHSKLITLRSEEEEEIRRILKKYSEKVSENGIDISTIDKEMLEFDIYYAKTRYASDMGYEIPKVSDKRYIYISSGRHPLIGKDAIPLDLTIGEEFKILIITGPNTGGKTVVLKSVGLFSAMVQCSIPIPASSDSHFCLFDTIFVDIGDEQSIENSLSTFSGHIKNIINILNYSTKNSLVLIDELCAGTDPIEGQALAIAILKEFKNKGVISITSTHYGGLKNFASKEDNIENGSMEFDNTTLAPTYRLLTGIPGSSKALEISKRLGLSENILNHAKENINPHFLESDKLLAQIEDKNRQLQQKEIKLSNYEDELNEKEQNIKIIKERLKEKEEELNRILKLKESEFLKESRREFENLVKEIKCTNASKESIASGSEFFAKVKEHLHKEGNNTKENLTNSDVVFDKGDEVKIVSSGIEGYIVDKSNNPNEWIVQAGIIKVNVRSSYLIKNDIKTEAKKQKSDNISGLFIPSSAPLSVDLRGLRYDEAEKKLDEFISRSLSSNNKCVRVIHGKGSGALRRCIQEYFDNSPFVLNFDFEKDDRNGVNYGITIAQLR